MNPVTWLKSLSFQSTWVPHTCLQQDEALVRARLLIFVRAMLLIFVCADYRSSLDVCARARAFSLRISTSTTLSTRSIVPGLRPPRWRLYSDSALPPLRVCVHVIVCM